MFKIIFSWLPLFALMGVFFLVKEFLDKPKNYSKSKYENEDYKYYVKKEYFMSEAESVFFKVLKEAVQDKYYIVPQVQISNLVYVNRYEFQKGKYFEKIKGMSVDFVLFNKEKYSPEIIIELDETSHMLPRRERRDNFVDAIFNRVGIQIVHIKTAYNYDLDEITKFIQKNQ